MSFQRICLAFSVLCSTYALADQVVPTDRVANGVNIRESPTSNSASIGGLAAGESIEWVQDSGRWREVRLSPTVTGWVSTSWTRRISTPTTPSAAEGDGPIPPKKMDEIRIHYLPVGAGTCTVVECPGADASPMIIDCGSLGAETRGPTDMNEDQATSAVLEILSGHGASPNVVISHPDKDHFAYLDSIFPSIQASNIWLGGRSTDYTAGVMTSITTEVNAEGAELHQDLPIDFHHNQTEMGPELSCGTASVYILTVNSGTSKNANSLVVSIDYRDFSAIFTGDAEVSTETQAINNFDEAVKTTVLSSSHHGADTHGSNGSPKGADGNPSEWPQMTAPEVVIYSHGRKFGHPRCDITGNYHPFLKTVPAHLMHCGTDNDDSTPTPDTTTLAEYSTEVAGAVVVTTDGRSPLSIHCSASSCAAEINY